MKERPSLLYRLIRALVQFFYPKTAVEYLHEIPNEPVIYVANHAQMHGPIACELYLPGQHCTWCAGEMMQLQTVPDYAFRDFWSHKPRYSRWFFRLLSYMIAPLSVVVFNNANTIGVYHDNRILSTFRQTVQHLQQGCSVVIFPECDTPANAIVNAFQERFVDVAKLYYKRTGKEVLFVPLYIAPKLGTMYVGEGVRFDAAQPLEPQRRCITQVISQRITAIAQSLPAHRVVPYNNMPKRQYPTNLDKERIYENTCC